MTPNEEYSASTKVRDQGIDALRWMAITGIIIAHVSPPAFWMQLRSFDVPLMVLLSGMCFGTPENLRKGYYWKRFVRLVVPSWIFLTFYFLISFMIGQEVGLKRLMMCYSLLTPWYFWIIRILFILALLSPILVRLSNKLSITQLFAFMGCALMASEFLSSVSTNYLYKIALMLVPYTIYYLVGMNFKRFSKTFILSSGIFWLACYLILAIYFYYKTGTYILTGTQKYPPHLLYSLCIRNWSISGLI